MTTQHEGPRPQAGTDPCPLLLVEDAPDLRYLLVLVLTEAGYAVTAVATGRAALAALAQAPSIIICPI